MTGPSGPVYAIADGAADYGALGDGPVGSCTECFSVSVSDPGERPAVRWDASVVESILPDVQGQQ